jgi:hypothetical protein
LAADAIGVILGAEKDGMTLVGAHVHYADLEIGAHGSISRANQPKAKPIDF